MHYEAIPLPTEREIPSQSWRPPSDVRMISADDHNMEVENLWEDRLPPKWRDRAPKHWRDAEGNWHSEVDGKPLDVLGIRQDIAESHPGFTDRDLRLRMMDAEGIEAT